jgi:PKD repeat protein
MEKNEMEDLFKRSFENFEAEVNPGVWEKVQLGLKGYGLAFLAKKFINKIGLNTIVIVVTSSVAILSTVFFMNRSKKTENVSTVSTIETKNNKPATITKVIASSKEVVNTTVAKKEKASEKVTPVSETTVLPENKKGNKKLESLVNTLAKEDVASISASCVGGVVPLIINLSNAGTGKINKWSYNDGSKPVTLANPIKVFDTPGIYTITLVSKGADGTTDIDSIKVEATGNSSLRPSSNASFSPNGDKIDDEFVFKSVNIAKMSAIIVDSKGNIVYDYKGIECRWDGKDLKGEKVKEGTYFYIMSAEGFDGKKYAQKGKVNLTR